MARKANNTPKEEEMPAQSNFSSMLSQFVSGEQDWTVSTPFHLPLMENEDTKKRRRGSYENIDASSAPISLELDDVENLLPSNDIGDEYDPTFDELIEKAFTEDEDVTLKNSLISMGRKYAIKGMEDSEDTSELTKSFAKQEQQIGMLIDELNSDAVAVQKDIDMMRTMRSRSYKSMADLISTKVAMSNAKLAAIKELTNIQKTKYDISIKLKSSKNSENQDGDAAASHAIQKILSMGRASLMSDNDYSSSVSPGDATYMGEDPNSLIGGMTDVPAASSDGDFFIQHESEGVEYVLDIDRETDTRQIYAVDRNGMVVSDYPLPNNPDQLQFNFNTIAGEATDQLQRRYRLRYNGEDVAESAFKYDEDDSMSF